MKVVTTRVEEKDVEELEIIEKEEKSDRAEVVRRLLSSGIKEWKMAYALKKLKAREVSIGKAAKMAGVSYADMLDCMGQENIDIGYTQKDLEKDVAHLKRGA